MQSTRRKYLFLSHAGALVLGVTLLLGLNACTPPVTETRVPQRWAVVQLSDHRERFVIPGEMTVAPNGYVYVVDYMGAVEVFDGLTWVATIPWPDHQLAKRSFAQIVAHPENGYVYLSDSGYDTVHVIRDTELITSLHIGGKRARYLAIDPQSGYLYAVGSKDMIVPENIPVNTLGIIDGAQLISRTEWQRVETGSIAYNPVDGFIYLGQYHMPPLTHNP